MKKALFDSAAPGVVDHRKRFKLTKEPPKVRPVGPLEPAGSPKPEVQSLKSAEPAAAPQASKTPAAPGARGVMAAVLAVLVWLVMGSAAWAQYTTNPPTVISLPGATSNTNPPSSTGSGFAPLGTVGVTADTNGNIIWPPKLTGNFNLIHGFDGPLPEYLASVIITNPPLGLDSYSDLYTLRPYNFESYIVPIVNYIVAHGYNTNYWVWVKDDGTDWQPGDEMGIGPNSSAWTNAYPHGLSNMVNFLHTNGMFYCAFWRTTNSFSFTNPIIPLSVSNLNYCQVDGIAVDSSGGDFAGSTPDAHRAMLRTICDAAYRANELSRYPMRRRGIGVFTLGVANTENPQPGYPTQKAINVADAITMVNVYDPSPDIPATGSDGASTVADMATLIRRNLYYSYLVRPGHYLDCQESLKTAQLSHDTGLSNEGNKAMFHGAAALVPFSQMLNGNDIPFDPYIPFYSNSEIQRYYMDAAAIPGHVAISNQFDMTVVRPMGSAASGTNLVGLFNYHTTSQSFPLYASLLGVSSNVVMKVRDPVNGVDVGQFVGATNLSVAQTNIGVYAVFPVPATLSTDALANAFLTMRGITDPASQAAVTGFISTLENGGLWSSLVDGVLLKTNLGASASSVVSLAGRSADIAGLSFDAFGAVFDGSSTRVVLTNLPDCTTNTIILTTREPAVSQYTSWGNHSAAGLWGTYLDGERVEFNGYWAPYFTTNNTDGGFNGAYLLNWPGPGGIGNGTGGYSLMDGFRHVVAFSYSSNYVSAYLDGWMEYTNSYYGKYLTTHPLTNLFLGTQPSSSGYTLYHTGEISSALVFNGVLSPLQIRTVEQALRWLEPGDENVLVVGDSTADVNAPIINGTSETAGAGWDSVIANGGRWNGNVNFHVLAAAGVDANVYWAGPGLDYLRGWMTNELVSHGLGGKVTKLTVFVDLGHNDRGVQADSLATSETALSNICYAAKAAGGVVWAFTTPYAANGGSMWWTSAQEAIRQQENQWLRANPGFYDHLVDRDLLFTVSEANGADGVIFASGTLAGVHLAAGGNQRLADAILGEANGVPIYAPSYSRSGLVTGLTRDALFVVTNGPAAWPVSPPMPGAVALVSSNGFPFVLVSTNGSGGVSSAWTGTNRWQW